MANTNPARGMRDFLPSDVRKREYVIGIIKEVYQKYGFEPLETPSVENLETLMGKYGEEGNQLIFKILERGEKIQKKLAEGTIKSENELSDLALRYDLTVPLARVVANYKDKLPKFFKRYQIQPVWRADRPARGRFREFYQCDVDAIGSSSMVVEAELISAVCEILERLGFEDVGIVLNHRELLRSILNCCGIPEEFHVKTLTILDKYDKIGSEGVAKELYESQIPVEGVVNLLDFIKKDLGQVAVDKQLKNVIELNQDILGRIASLIKEDVSGEKALNQVRQIFNLLENKIAEKGNLIIDATLARGLSYYTGAIFEVRLKSGDFSGSVGGGGRYDGLIGMFGKEQIPACGFSLGLERILVVMEERGMFKKPIEEGKLKLDSADVMVACFDENLVSECLKLANDLRQIEFQQNYLRVLVYPEVSQKAKPYKYAEQIEVPFVCLLRENELKENKILLKNMATGEQEIVDRQSVGEKLKSKK